ncbi:RNA polymerase sigma factor [Streptomyces sp. NPDC060022]|uniref:RNA polymerase sigma factor n=1 Tax=Streptomyces sp. NPDC060022 TaxID=3347039 RepID=UPI0036B0E5AC
MTKQAFAEVLEHRLHLYKALRSWGAARHVVEDIVSVVGVRYVQRRRTGPVAHVRAYLTTMARNTFLDHVEGSRKEALVGETQELDLLLEQERSVDYIVADTFAAEELMLKIASLSPKMRKVIELSFLKELPLLKVAAEMQMTPNAVRRHRVRAIQRLRELYDQAPMEPARPTALHREAPRP